MAEDAMSKVYEAFGKLQDSGEHAASQEPSFLFLLEATKKDAKCKQLVAGFIPKFLHHFPALADQAINAMFDLCEDPELMIRVHAIRGLAELCKHSPQHVQRVADVLSQLLISEASLEIQATKRSLDIVVDLDLKASLTALLTQITDGDATVKAKCLEHVKGVLEKKKAVLSKDLDLQNHVATSLVSVLANVSMDDLKAILALLGQFPGFKANVDFQAEVAKALLSHAALDQPFDPATGTANFVSSARSSMPMLGKDGSAGFTEYFVHKVVPSWDAVDEASQLELLKLLTDLCRLANASSARLAMEPVLKLLRLHLPLKTDEAKAEGAEAPKLKILPAEALLFSFHALAPKDATLVRSLTGLFVPTGQPSDFGFGVNGATEQANKADLVARLTTLNTACTAHAKKIKEVLKVKPNKDATEEEKKAFNEQRTKASATLRSVENCSAMASALLAKEPKYVAASTFLSWSKRKGPGGKGAGRGAAGSGKGAAKPGAKGSNKKGVATSKPQQGQKRKNQNQGGNANRSSKNQRTGNQGSNKKQSQRSNKKGSNKPQQGQKRKSQNQGNSNQGSSKKQKQGNNAGRRGGRTGRGGRN